MEAASAMRLLPVFDYEPKRGCEPSSRWEHSRLQGKGQRLCGVTRPPVVNTRVLSTETNGQTTAKCRELNKALMSSWIKGGQSSFRKGPVGRHAEPHHHSQGIRRRHIAYNMEGAYTRGPVGCGNLVGPVIVPIMIFDGREGCSFSFPHNNLMVIELKVASTLVRKILTNASSSADIMSIELS
ncbi:hypothetical protein Cgig2_030659 [Carnegiea gigantea]|uniref:Uncharacterized protein n=1 Tax=Carnegiea gigantea TaxID=171969 RepID=A0A9Q1QB74_9CARY|nr:hypothetical protein Cgig2_030659 [Carnegiea gigantea]